MNFSNKQSLKEIPNDSITNEKNISKQNNLKNFFYQKVHEIGNEKSPTQSKFGDNQKQIEKINEENQQNDSENNNVQLNQNQIISPKKSQRDLQGQNNNSQIGNLSKNIDSIETPMSNEILLKILDKTDNRVEEAKLQAKVNLLD